MFDHGENRTWPVAHAAFGEITMFFDGFGTLKIECDAPGYAIVRACRKLGFKTPEDVRWCRVSRARPAPPKKRGGLLAQAFRAIFRKTASRRAGCICRCQSPELDKYTYTLASGGEKHLFLGQCRQCLTIFWKEP
jgi:hypothetical protein